jgi:hypothetical protein
LTWIKIAVCWLASYVVRKSNKCFLYLTTALELWICVNLLIRAYACTSKIAWVNIKWKLKCVLVIQRRWTINQTFQIQCLRKLSTSRSLKLDKFSLKWPWQWCCHCWIRSWTLKKPTGIKVAISWLPSNVARETYLCLSNTSDPLILWIGEIFCIWQACEDARIHCKL